MRRAGSSLIAPPPPPPRSSSFGPPVRHLDLTNAMPRGARIKRGRTMGKPLRQAGFTQRPPHVHRCCDERAVLVHPRRTWRQRCAHAHAHHVCAARRPYPSQYARPQLGTAATRFRLSDSRTSMNIMSAIPMRADLRDCARGGPSRVTRPPLLTAPRTARCGRPAFLPCGSCGACRPPPPSTRPGAS